MGRGASRSRGGGGAGGSGTNDDARGRRGGRGAGAGARDGRGAVGRGGGGPAQRARVRGERVDEGRVTGTFGARGHAVGDDGVDVGARGADVADHLRDVRVQVALQRRPQARREVAHLRRDGKWVRVAAAARRALGGDAAGVARDGRGEIARRCRGAR